MDPRAVSGPNLLGSLSLEWPFGNHAARGLLLQRQAEQQQSELRGEALARTIHSGILVALGELDHTRAQVERAALAVANYNEAVAREQRKLRLGTATILDVIVLSDRMDDSKLSLVSARARYAIALARVRFETGLLIKPGSIPDSPLSVEDLNTLPNWEANGGH